MTSPTSPSSVKKSKKKSKSPSKFAKIRTIALVSFLTIVIWLLAESRMIQTRTIELQLVLVGSTQDIEHEYVVRPARIDEWSSSIDVELEGSLASLDAVSRALKGRVPMVVGDQIPSRSGTHDLDFRSILRTLPTLQTNGVSIRSLSLDSAQVQVEELVSYDLPIRVDLPPQVALDGPARAIPQTITVRAPESFIERLRGREAFASPPPNSISPLVPGRLESIPSVAVTLPINQQDISSPGWEPVLTPARADVRLTIRSLTQTITIDRLPIQVLMAPGEVGRWDVILNPGSEDLVSVQISGPTDTLTAISEGEIVPTAVLSLSYEELERGITSKNITILGLPAQVELTSILPEIGFQISRKPEAFQTDPSGP
ncbi:MAG: hypothetical protein AB8C13_07140 [Phycisphaerales bacterium]